jgi:cytoskeletal protein RodZ
LGRAGFHVPSQKKKKKTTKKKERKMARKAALVSAAAVGAVGLGFGLYLIWRGRTQNPLSAFDARGISKFKNKTKPKKKTHLSPKVKRKKNHFSSFSLLLFFVCLFVFSANTLTLFFLFSFFILHLVQKILDSFHISSQELRRMIDNFHQEMDK